MSDSGNEIEVVVKREKTPSPPIPEESVTVDREKEPEEVAADGDDDFIIVPVKKEKKGKKEKGKDKKERKKRAEEKAENDEEAEPEAEAEAEEPDEPKRATNVHERHHDETEEIFDPAEEDTAMAQMVAGHEGHATDADDLELLHAIKETKASDEKDDKRPATKELLESITLLRTRDLVPHAHLHFFKDFVVGSYVRGIVAPGTRPKYALFEVTDAIPTGEDPVTGAALVYKVGDVVTDWLLVCRSGRHTRHLKLTHISNEFFTEEEFISYTKRMDKAGIPVVSKSVVLKKRKENHKLIRAYYMLPLSNDDVNAIVETRARLRGTASVNLVRTKMILQAELEEIARQELEVEKSGAFMTDEEVAAAELRKHQKQFELEETEKKLQSVLYGQNSSNNTLAALTHRNIAGNKDRLEAEDPIDAIVFGRKQGRSGKSYWSVHEGGFKVKEKDIADFWSQKEAKEQEEKETTIKKREEEKKIGTCPIKDVPEFIKKVGGADEDEVPSSQPSQNTVSSQPQSPPVTQRPSQKRKAANTPEKTPTRRRIELGDFLKRKELA